MFLPTERIIFLRVKVFVVQHPFKPRQYLCGYFFSLFTDYSRRTDRNCILWLTQEMNMTKGVSRAVMQFRGCTHIFLENSLRFALLSANGSFLMKKFPRDLCNKV